MEKSIIKICIIAAGAICCIGQIAGAEGGGKRQGKMEGGQWKGSDWGVNRRVITQEGYTEVSGTFTVNDMVIPKDINGKITPRSNYADDKPTFYLGSKGGTAEVDAGLQYETKIGQDPNGFYYSRGWSIVFSKNGSYTTIRKDSKVSIGDETQTRALAWRGYGNEYLLDYKIWPGGTSFDGVTVSKGAVSLKVGGDFGGTVFYHGVSSGGGTPPKKPTPTNIKIPGIDVPQETPDGSPLPAITEDEITETLNPPANASVSPGPQDAQVVYGSTPLTAIAVKRVIGITQGKNFKGITDGSSFSCTFSGGTLTKKKARPTNPPYQTSTQAWDSVRDPDDVDQSKTGYDTSQESLEGDDPAKNRLLEGHPTPNSTYKVSFPNLTVANDGDPRDESAESDAATYNNTGKRRYTLEDDVFDLGYVARPWGFAVVPRK